MAAATRVTGVGFLAVVLCAVLSAVFLPGCDEQPKDPSVEKVTISGKTFTLELALDDETRFRGLSGRESIPEDGGMLFVFPDRGVRQHQFVMRDCPVPIDIMYLSASGHIVAMHEMLPEPPRKEDEQVAPGQTTNAKYEARLKKYPSRFPAQFVIELKGGTMKTLKLKEGQKIDLDLAGLKKRAK